MVDQLDGAIEQIEGIVPILPVRLITKLTRGDASCAARDNPAAWEDGHLRNETLQQIKAKGWQLGNENPDTFNGSGRKCMYRLKQLFGDPFPFRLVEMQVVEVHTHIAAINILAYLGVPPIGSTRTSECMKKIGMGREP